MTTIALAVPAPRAVNKWFIAAAVALGALLEIIDTSIVNVALTDMQAELGATLSQVSWVVSSYAVATSSSSPSPPGSACVSARRTTSSSPWSASPPRRSCAAFPLPCRC
jgi:MFS family permease